MIRALVACLLAGLVAEGALAHKPSDSYLTLRASERELSGQWDIALRDLELAIGLDADGDAAITWGELRAQRGAVFAYALARLRLETSGAACDLQPLGLRADRHSDGAYAVLDFRANCGAAVDALSVAYSLLFDLDAQHRGLLRFESASGGENAIFSTDLRERSLEPSAPPGAWSGFSDYVREGVWHIAIGADHVLFLVSLLLPAVFRREGARWVPVASLGAAAGDAARVVTAFTAAHSITLALATLGLVSLPSRWVESAIAASVAIAALHNLFPIFERARTRMAFGFGLIHGLGFASVLGDLGLARRAIAVPLVGFNLGVELGQLAGVALFVPLAYALRARPVYRCVALVAGSCAIALIGSLWFAQRAFDLGAALLPI
jgi:hypothetical protein